jgi:hypothetical protein
MPRIELPSGAWVEYRDALKVKDRFAVQEVAKVDIREEGNSTSFLAMQNDMRNALLARIITAWSYGVPIPSQNSFQAADVIIGDAMDLDDYATLEAEIQPLMDKIAGRGAAPDPKKPSAD